MDDKEYVLAAADIRRIAKKLSLCGRQPCWKCGIPRDEHDVIMVDGYFFYECLQGVEIVDEP
jgi:hypothetical protein